jgi:hypothetical protein
MHAPTLSSVEAARAICQEARVVLTSLRGGPPHVARGELAQDLFDLRQRLQNKSITGSNDNTINHDNEAVARPFLQVIMDPRAAGPHTLVALRALVRLLRAGALTLASSTEALVQGTLACKFEQTDAGADEAVEMAIADLLCLIIRMNYNNSTKPSENLQAPMRDATLHDAFQTVFMTRNTFVHSPALCLHFEDVLQNMLEAVFQSQAHNQACRVLVEFLIHQLLHTPLVGGDDLDESVRDAQISHDATRILCLRMTRMIIKTEWITQDEAMLSMIQDELSLSLLMTGQAIWAYHDTHTNISPGFVSLEVLSEVRFACVYR